MEAENPVTPAPQPADDKLLEDLAAFTGLFNPERIWQEEMLSDDIEDAEQRAEEEGTAGLTPDTP